jgi:hypothetical protein
MNYYIIPKNNFNIQINPVIKSEIISPFISYSLIYFLNNIYTQLLNIDELKACDKCCDKIGCDKPCDKGHNTMETTIEYINRIVNPFEFIHTNVPGSSLSVSKVKPSSNIFFELMEVFQVCSITDILSIKKQINIAHLTSNNSSTIDLLNMLREDNDDTIIDIEFDYKTIYNRFIETPLVVKIDLFIFEFKETDYIDTNQYIKNMILVLYIIVNNQSNFGTSIIKIDNIFYKSIVDILFIFSAIFEKVFLIKPSISKITKGERFIICKNMNIDMLSHTKLLHQLDQHLKMTLANKLPIESNIHSIIDNDIPYYFSNKIEESNAVIGQQQLEAYDQIINIFKNKNKDEKIEVLKRNHIQKCIQWCEKNQLPHNKFVERVNIFLNAKKRDEEKRDEEKRDEEKRDEEKRDEENKDEAGAEAEK